jgi:hypothetical protein
MTALVGSSTLVWLIGLSRDRSFWSTVVDVIAILLATSLPWSTIMVGVFSVALLIAILPFLDGRAFGGSLKRPIAYLPIGFFLFALVGTLWSDGALGERLHGVFPFERSERGFAVFVAFLVSCVLVMMMSWIVALFPALTLKEAAANTRGIFRHAPQCRRSQFPPAQPSPH